MGKNFWDKVAGNYDKNTEEVYSDANKKIIELTRIYCKEGSRLIDIGCGTGMITMDIAGSVSTVDAFDSSDEMLRIAKEKSSIKNISNINWEKIDALDIKNLNKEYDLATVFNLLLYLKNPEEFINDVKNKLVPGGYFISVTDCNGEEKIGLFKRFVLFLSKLGILPYIYPYRMEELSQLFINAGFEIEFEKNVHSQPPNYFIVAKK